MKRYAWVMSTFLIVVLLVVVEMTIITNASGYETKAEVVFAKVQIDENTVITREMLEIREISAGAVHPDALKTIEIAVLKRACVDIAAGEMLLDVKLSSSGSGLIEAEDKNKRLFSVEFKGDQANGWQLSDGQYVDLIYVPHDSAKQEQQPETEGVAAAEPSSDRIKVLKNIRIAGIIGEDGKLVDISEAKGTPRYISFEVTEEQAVFLAYAKTSGKIELSCIPGK